MELSLTVCRRKLPAMSRQIIDRELVQTKIRRVARAEADCAYGLVTEYYETVPVVARETRERFLSDYFSPAAGLWLAWAGDETAGCIALRGLDGMKSAEIKRMYVRPAWRGIGLAQKLLEAAESFAKEVGYLWLYLDTTDEMKAAAQLYERNGYQPCARYNDNPQATIFMRKKL